MSTGDGCGMSMSGCERSAGGGGWVWTGARGFEQTQGVVQMSAVGSSGSNSRRRGRGILLHPFFELFFMYLMKRNSGYPRYCGFHLTLQ